MILYLIRHAQSENNVLDDRRSGQTGPDTEHHLRKPDPGLTERGFAQADHLAKYLANCPDKTDIRDGLKDVACHRIGKLFCSPMKRAIQTAHAVAKATQLKPELWIDVHEEGGIWRDDPIEGNRVGSEGMTRQEMTSQFPNLKLIPEITDRGWWNRPFETREQMEQRAESVADHIDQLSKNSNEIITIVSHGTFIIFLIRQLTTHNGHSIASYSHQNTGITRLDFSPDGLRVRFANKLEHLPSNLIA